MTTGSGAREKEFGELWSGSGGGKSDGLPIGALRRTPTMRAQVRAAVQRAPQVMVKITGGGRGMRAISESMDYVSKDGEREVETDDGTIVKGGAELHALKKVWQYGNSEIPAKSTRREAHNVIFSMPKGTEAAIVKAAARDVARIEFAGHHYMMVLHEHQRNPHVHVLVRAEADNGERLNPRKADLHRWREHFAAVLRTYGISAAATRQPARGVVTAPKQLWQVHATRNGSWQKPRPDLKSGEAMLATRTKALTQWDDIVRHLANSKDLEDQKLAKRAEGFVGQMPAQRLVTPHPISKAGPGRDSGRAQGPER